MVLGQDKDVKVAHLRWGAGLGSTLTHFVRSALHCNRCPASIAVISRPHPATCYGYLMGGRPAAHGAAKYIKGRGTARPALQRQKVNIHRQRCSFWVQPRMVSAAHMTRSWGL